MGNCWHALVFAAGTILACNTACAQRYAGLASQGMRGNQELPPVELRQRPVSPDAPGRWRNGLVFRGLGLRGSVTRVEVGGVEGWEGSGLLHQRAYGLLTIEWISARYADSASVGYGSAGLEGEATLDLAVGVRIPVGEHHGPVARLGIRGDLAGNDALFAGTLETPQLQLGYQWLGHGIRADLVARGGWVVLGRYEPGASERDLDGTPELGALLSLGYERIQLDVGWSRLFAEGGTADGPVDRSEASFCVLFAPFAACADMRSTHGDAVVIQEDMPRERDASAFYAGASLTFSDIERH